MYYTFVGSRETPVEILDIIFKISASMALKGYILRSGGANGADAWAEKGCDSVNGKKEIYLPWRFFNGNLSSFYDVSEKALQLAETIHPSWQYLKHGARLLHGRNCYQVLGLNLDKPSKVLICWTKNGEKIGGTRTAMVLAENNNIPVFNLAIEQDLKEVLKRLNLNTI